MSEHYVIGGGKGGVGKSTIAIHLAVHLHRAGKNVAVVDCDTEQRTSAKFFERTHLYEIPHATEKRDLLQNLTEADRSIAATAYSGFDAVVFDAPGDIRISKPLFRIADVVVLPSPPQYPDVEDVMDAAAVVAAVREKRVNGCIEVMVVPTKVDPRTKVARRCMDLLELVNQELRVSVSRNHLNRSIRFPEAYANYSAIWDLRGAPSKPRDQMERLVREIEGYGERTREQSICGRESECETE